MMPFCSRRLACAALTAIVVGSGGCTVADNLSAGEILDELDAIVTVRPAGADTSVLYASRAEVSRWFARTSLLLLPIRPVLVVMLGGTANDAIALPRVHVRELLRELPDEVGSDPLLAALAASRLGWIAEYEPNAQSRVVAIDDHDLFPGNVVMVEQRFDRAASQGAVPDDDDMTIHALPPT